jgi:hypothetical protein
MADWDFESALSREWTLNRFFLEFSRAYMAPAGQAPSLPLTIAW